MQKFNVIIAGAQYTGMTLAELASVSADAAKAALCQYADAALAQRDDAGVSVALSGGRTALVDTTGKGRANILGLAGKAARGLPLTWYQSTGDMPISTDDLTAIETAVDAYVEGLLGVWQRTLAGIASGAIASTAQVDAAFA